MLKRNIDINEFCPPEAQEKKPCHNCEHCTCKKEITNEEIIENVAKDMINILEH